MLKSNLRTPLLAVMVMVCLGLAIPIAVGQSIFGTLIGSVVDSSGGFVPNANVTLKNAESGDLRKTVTNSDGYFTFSSVPVGTYTLTVEAPGFQKYQETGLAFTGAEKKNVNIALKVGGTTEQVDVVSAADVLTPVDSGEKAATLTTKQLQDFSVVGRSAAEFIKILPGFSIIGTATENRPTFPA